MSNYNITTATVITRTLSTVWPPEALLAAWANAAMEFARADYLDDYWAASVPDRDMDGAWVDGDTPEDALARLPHVLMDWAELEIEGHGRPLPIFGGFDVNRPAT